MDAVFEYEGVYTHGPLHKARMRDVHFQQSQIEFYKILAIVSATLGDRGKASSHLKNVLDLLFPGSAKLRAEREEKLAGELALEGQKNYYIREVRYSDG